MPALETIESEIKSLSREQALELQAWLAEYLDNQEELNPDFVAAIERGKEDIRQGRVRQELILLMQQATEIYSREFDRVISRFRPDFTDASNQESVSSGADWNPILTSDCKDARSSSCAWATTG